MIKSLNFYKPADYPCTILLNNTLQIDKPTVMRIEKDVSATFADQLGVVGMISV